MESLSRPLGGIASLTLGVASPVGAAPTLPEGGSQIPLLEDRSTYTEAAAWIGSSKSVKHTLTAITSLEYELPAEIEEALVCGFVALIGFNSRSEICVGWSAAAASDRALRLVSCSTYSEEKPSSRGYKEWVFESTDSVSNI
ncbi:MAG: hypothetical protein SNH73_03190 [Rikenellaceae bacterium]